MFFTTLELLMSVTALVHSTFALLEPARARGVLAAVLVCEHGWSRTQAHAFARSAIKEA